MWLASFDQVHKIHENLTQMFSSSDEDVNAVSLKYIDKWLLVGIWRRDVQFSKLIFNQGYVWDCFWNDKKECLLSSAKQVLSAKRVLSDRIHILVVLLVTSANWKLWMNAYKSTCYKETFHVRTYQPNKPMEMGESINGPRYHLIWGGHVVLILGIKTYSLV